MKDVIRTMSNIIYQVREFHDGTFSLMARVYNPQKSFWEHPAHIGYVNKEDVIKLCKEYEQYNLSVEEIMKEWDFIGD